MNDGPVRVCIRCTVHGTVQGVFFRATTREQARHLGIAGYAKNLPGGCVEVMAYGEPMSLDMLKEWLWQGSKAAHVTHVECEPVSVSERYFSDFQIL